MLTSRFCRPAQSMRTRSNNVFCVAPTIRILALVSILTGLPGPVFADLFWGPDNFDDCFVERMKGQDRSMGMVVRRACEREFEVELNSEARKLVNIEWTESTSDSATFTVGQNDSDFKIYRAILRFSEVECGEAKDDDFNITGTVDFSSWRPHTDPRLQATIKLANSSKLKCMRTKVLIGKRFK